MGNQNDDMFFLPYTDSFENVAGYVQGLLNKAIADTNAGITAVGVPVLPSYTTPTPSLPTLANFVPSGANRTQLA